MGTEMAARLNKRHSELVLARIRTSQLVNRLQNSVLPDEKGQVTPLTAEQVRSACFLIERTLARAENPKDLNVTGNLSITVATGIPDANANR